MPRNHGNIQIQDDQGWFKGGVVEHAERLDTVSSDNQLDRNARLGHDLARQQRVSSAVFDQQNWDRLGPYTHGCGGVTLIDAGTLQDFFTLPMAFRHGRAVVRSKIARICWTSPRPMFS